MNTTEEKKTFVPTEEQQGIIDRLVALQADSKNAKGQPKSDGEFSRDLSVKDSTWNLIKSGKYWTQVKNGTDIIAKLEIDLRNLSRKSALKSRYGSKKFIELPDFSAIFSAVEECQDKPLSDPDRYIAYLAPTGGGKSAGAGECAKRFNAEIIEQTEGWKKSRTVVYRVTGQTLGVKGIEKMIRPDEIQAKVIEFLKTKNMVLIFDEGEFTGAAVLNFFKAILNQTKTVILHYSNPRPYHNLAQWYPYEFEQIKRRTHLLVEQKAILPEDVALFLRQNVQLPSFTSQRLTDASRLIAGAANTFGRYDFITRIVKRLQDAEECDYATVEKAITNEKACMGKEGK